MAKQEKEIERWVTVNGVRVPIFKDGSIGGPKALQDKIKKSGKKESKNKDDGSKERLSTYERQLAEVNDELANAPKSKALRNEEGIKELEKKKAQLEGYIAKEKESVNQKAKTDNITSAKTHKELTDKLSKNGLKLDSADAHTMENSNSLNGEKVTMYDKDGNEYRGTYNKYSDSGREIVNIKKTGESPRKIARDNEDLKEKQIAKNKAEKEEANKQINQDNRSRVDLRIEAGKQLKKDHPDMSNRSIAYTTGKLKNEEMKNYLNNKSVPQSIHGGPMGKEEAYMNYKAIKISKYMPKEKQEELKALKAKYYKIWKG